MSREHHDPYVVLGISRQATTPEIARAYRRLARQTHPDSNLGRSSSGDDFRAVSEAYETLRDPQRRAAYDNSHPPIRHPSPSRGAPRPRAVRYGPPGIGHVVLSAEPLAPGPVPRSVRLSHGGAEAVAGFSDAAAATEILLTLLRRRW